MMDGDDIDGVGYENVSREHINLIMSVRAAAGTRALQCFETTRTKPETKSEDAFDSSNINSSS